MGVKKKTTSKGEGMVDVGAKAVTKRAAVAEATIRMTKKAFADLTGKGSPKGNVFETARTAGILAAKSTPKLIPFCHPLMLTKVNVRFQPDSNRACVRVEAEVACSGQTGVEMEAMTAASVAALTVYDMMKWSDAGMVISDVRLLSKRGGKSGDFQRT